MSSSAIDSGIPLITTNLKGLFLDEAVVADDDDDDIVVQFFLRVKDDWRHRTGASRGLTSQKLDGTIQLVGSAGLGRAVNSRS